MMEMIMDEEVEYTYILKKPPHTISLLVQEHFSSVIELVKVDEISLFIVRILLTWMLMLDYYLM
jgi:hypothetical protein